MTISGNMGYEDENLIIIVEMMNWSTDRRKLWLIWLSYNSYVFHIFKNRTFSVQYFP